MACEPVSRRPMIASGRLEPLQNFRVTEIPTVRGWITS
jgi:hypothetical protein